MCPLGGGNCGDGGGDGSCGGDGGEESEVVTDNEDI